MVREEKIAFRGTVQKSAVLCGFSERRVESAACKMLTGKRDELPAAGCGRIRVDFGVLGKAEFAEK